MSRTGCPVCGSLQDVETSFSKYGAPALDRPLPAAASHLTAIRIVGAEAPERRHTRRCPACSALFAYRLTYDYQANGSEDEETLTRLSPADASAFVRSEASSLETLRRDVDRLRTEAGQAADYIDRGCSRPEEIREATGRMERLNAEAAQAGRHLADRVQALRESCREILDAWADAHRRVLEALLEAGFPPGPDAGTSRFSAREALAAWKALPDGGEAFVATDIRRLPDYEGRLDAELRHGPITVWR